MKRVYVPAQVTTIEDRVVGNLTMTQLILVAGPIFIGAIVYVLLYPSFSFALYKMYIILIGAVFSSCLAIRIRERLVLDWLQLVVRFVMRPQIYVYNKNSLDGRHLVMFEQEDSKDVEVLAVEESRAVPVSTPLQERVRIDSLVADPLTRFKVAITKEGKLSVTLTQTQK